MTGSHYFTFRDQAVHYMTRPHDGAVNRPVESPAAWRSSKLPELEALSYRLTDDDLAEVRAAVSHAASLGKPVLELSAQDLPLPSLSQRMDQWRSELQSGRGFQVIRGLPVAEWTEDQAAMFFWCFGQHLWVPGLQNPEGDLIGHVKDLRVLSEEPDARLYKTAAHINFHCDAADVVGLLCLKKAREGGASRISSSVTVFNDLIESRPDLAEALFEPWHLDNRDRETNAPDGALTVQPCAYADGMLRTFYHYDYFTSASRHDHVPELTPRRKELLALYEAIASNPANCFEMYLEPGDIQLVSNHTILHSRNGYVDHEDPRERRHLLRLWLSMAESASSTSSSNTLR